MPVFLRVFHIFIGFIGIVLIAQPSGFGFSKYDILGIFSGVGAALAYTSVRELKKYYDTRAIVLSFMSVGTFGPLILLFISLHVSIPELDFMLGSFVMPSGIVWLYVLAMGLLATLAQVYMTKAYGASKAGIIGAVSYTNIPFSILIGLVLGDSLPSVITAIGIVLVVMAGILVAKAK